MWKSTNRKWKRQTIKRVVGRQRRPCRHPTRLQTPFHHRLKPNRRRQRRRRRAAGGNRSTRTPAANPTTDPPLDPPTRWWSRIPATDTPTGTPDASILITSTRRLSPAIPRRVYINTLKNNTVQPLNMAIWYKLQPDISDKTRSRNFFGFHL